MYKDIKRTWILLYYIFTLKIVILPYYMFGEFTRTCYRFKANQRTNWSYKYMYNIQFNFVQLIQLRKVEIFTVNHSSKIKDKKNINFLVIVYRYQVLAFTCNFFGFLKYYFTIFNDFREL